MTTHDNAVTWFEQLGGMHRQIAVTDAAAQAVGFETAVDRVIRLAVDAHDAGAKLMFIGNGGSAAIASHMAIDYWKNGRLRSMAFNDGPLLTCISNDYGYDQVFAKPIEMFGKPDDVLIAISSGGKSPNILEAVASARRVGCSVVTLSGFGADNPLRSTGDLNFYVPSRAYGFVELTHLSICHCILDLSCERPRN